MQLLSPTASAALIIAVTLSVTTATAASDQPAQVTSAQFTSAQVTSAQVTSAQFRPAPPALPTALGGTPPLPDNAPAAASTPASTAEVGRRGFAWPLSPRPPLLRPFEQPLSQWSRGHRGVDLLTAVGQPVLSAGHGVVAFAGVVAGRGVITVRHSDGLRTTYEPVDNPLASGSLVRRGARIGLVSPSPGHCVPRTCLHWGAIAAGTYRDPLSLPAVLDLGRPVLLPLR